MDSSKAHLITLWCAVLAKSNKGVERLLPKGMPLAHFRVLTQLSLSAMQGEGGMALARSLVMKPADVEAALDVLQMKGLVAETADAQGFSDAGAPAIPVRMRRPALTEQGCEAATRLLESVSRYFEACRRNLQPSDREMLSTMLANALNIPGSYYAGRKALLPADLIAHPPYRMTAFAMMMQAISAAIKSSLGMSFTDFRFLLELYPKKRGVTKMLRARDMVSFLHTGRSYVTTTSLRLEEDGYIERIPDPDDARGILFRLTPAGTAVVQDVGEDIFAVFVSLSGEHVDDRRFVNALKLLLEGQDEAHVRVGERDAAL